MKKSKICQILLTFLIFSLCFSCARKKVTSAENSMRLMTKSINYLGDDLNIIDFTSGLKKHIELLEKKPDKNLVFGKKKISQSDYAQALKKLLQSFVLDWQQITSRSTL